MSEPGDEATSRPGAGVKGGIDPQPADPDTPARARARQAKDDEAHRRVGFGDDKGGDAE